MSHASRSAMAYLVSRYPFISHTFILREVLALRALGSPSKSHQLNEPDRAGEALRRRADRGGPDVRRGRGRAGARLAGTPSFLGASPIAYSRALWFALGLGRTDLRALVYHLFYFVEAVLVARWMKQRGLSHLHVHFATPPQAWR